MKKTLSFRYHKPEWIEVKAHKKNRVFAAKALSVIPSSSAQCKDFLLLTFTEGHLKDIPITSSTEEEVLTGIEGHRHDADVKED
ncbi:uncharacterized [Tachysurus ichikawai]